MEELSETTRNIGKAVGGSHEIQLGHFRMQVRRHCLIGLVLQEQCHMTTF